MARMGNRSGLLTMGIVGACAAGCASGGGAWKATGYSQTVFGYDVKFRDASAQALAGSDWRLDSHRYDPAAKGWVEKTGNDYAAIRRQDWDQNGAISGSETTKEPLFDLKIVNKKNNGVIWTKAHPLLPEEAELELEVVLNNYVDSLTGNGLYAQGNLFGAERPKVRNFTTMLVSKEITKIGGSDALTGTIEIAEVDRLKQDPQSRSGVVKLVLLKIHCLTEANCKVGSRADPIVYTAGPGVSPAGLKPHLNDPDLDRWPVANCRGKPCRARVGLLVIGYYNTPPYFAGGLPELADLLTRVSFADAMPVRVPPLAAKATLAPAQGKEPSAPAPPADTAASAPQTPPAAAEPR